MTFDFHQVLFEMNIWHYNHMNYQHDKLNITHKKDRAEDNHSLRTINRIHR